MAYNIFFTTNDKMPDDVVYNIVKMLHESKDELVKGQPVFRNFDPKAHDRRNRRAVAPGRDQVLQGNRPMAAEVGRA